MGDSTDRREAIKRGLGYSILPAVVAATFWDSGFVAMLGIFVVLLPFEVGLLLVAGRIARIREKRDASGTGLDLR